MPMSLDHLKVLDLTTHLSGPYCAMVLADHGADVVKVERPDGGDDMRRTPPFTGGESAPFMLWNRNKRSVALDLKSAPDLATFKAMAEVADVVIENFKPGTADRLGIGYDALSARNPPARLLLDLRVRPHRPVRAARRLRPHRRGHVRADEHQRTRGRTAVPHPDPHHRSRGGASTAPSASSPRWPPGSGPGAASTSIRRCSSPGFRWGSTRRPESSPPARSPNGSGRGIAAAPRTSSSPPPTAT